MFDAIAANEDSKILFQDKDAFKAARFNFSHPIIVRQTNVLEELKGLEVVPTTMDKWLSKFPTSKIAIEERCLLAAQL